MSFPVFYFDANSWFGLVDSVDRWQELVSAYGETPERLDRLLEAKMAPQSEINELPEAYFAGDPEVVTGQVPSFGFRREHIGGTIKLGEWAKSRACDLRKLAMSRPMA